MRSALFLTPMIGLCFFWQLGAVPLFDLDEGAFSAATWEMLQRGDFVTTYLNGIPRFDKPILIYWLQAASISLFGLQEWALRLPSALAATAWVWVTFQFAKPRYGIEAAHVATLMVASSIMIVLVGRAATADALLNLLIVLALFDIWRYWEHPNPWPLYRAFLWMGLGFLCKGPIAVFIPLLVSFYLYASQGQWRQWLRAAFNPIGWMLFLAVAAPWYILEYQAQGQAFIDGFFLKHHVGRFTTTMEGHGGNPAYYLLALPLILLPFSGLLPVLLFNLYSSLRGTLDRFLWVWFIAVFVSFSFSNTQLPHYLLYGITPLLLLLARYASPHTPPWLMVAPALVLVGLTLFLPELLQMVAAHNPSAYTQGLLEQANAVMGTSYRIAVGLTLLGLLILWIWHTLGSFHCLLGVATLQTLLLVTVLIPTVAAIQQNAVRDAALFARQHLAGQTIVMEGVNMPSFTVYRGQVTPKRAPQAGEYVFSKASHLQPASAYRIVFRQGGLVLAERQE